MYTMSYNSPILFIWFLVLMKINYLNNNCYYQCYNTKQSLQRLQRIDFLGQNRLNFCPNARSGPLAPQFAHFSYYEVF
jgi:hypothetical protein